MISKDRISIFTGDMSNPTELSEEDSNELGRLLDKAKHEGMNEDDKARLKELISNKLPITH